jgi:D-alanyl-D-alanine carboxypeptidase/D-alanyl-D-alanine-endopeptidase (penicillin-binding protein 4)
VKRALTACAIALFAVGLHAGSQSLTSDLDAIFADPALSRGMISARIDSLRTGETIYAKNADKLVMPASNMKILTMTVAAETLGWNFTYQTKLEAVGQISDGVLNGDLIVVGGGDPTILSNDGGPAPLFAEWAAALRKAGITRINCRIIGDDAFFDDDTLGMGWSWDDLVFGYGAPISGLSYNENQVVVRITPGAKAGEPAKVELSPAVGHGLVVTTDVVTQARPADAAPDARLRAAVSFDRVYGQNALVIRGTIPVGATPAVQTVAVNNPTLFFAESLRLALIGEGIIVSGASVDLDDITLPASAPRRPIATRASPPLSVIGPYFMKESQNYIAETLFKTLGKVVKGQGSADAGRATVLETLARWPDAIVMRDGSGLSRYNYVTTDAIVTMLTRMWKNDALRGPFAASLPVAAHDGTLSNRMKNTWLDAHVQAKTGTISNVRSLSGYLETKSGERMCFR